jgi:septum site-determining protein MinC
MAGVNGNAAARIYFQKKIEAELLAIDGYYLTAEDIDGYYKATEDIGGALRNGPAQAWLDGDTIRITPLA